MFKVAKPSGIFHKLSIEGITQTLYDMEALQSTEKIDYQGESIYIGIDVHKKNWGVCILTEHLEHKVFAQPPQPKVLAKYLHKHFPNADYYSAYEAGFCGFWIDQELRSLGISNLVVNPVDVPTTDKEKKRKNDKRDARKIAKELRNRNLEGIYVPDKDILQDRLLLRSRQKLLSDIRRCKCRIKSQLNFFGTEIPAELDNPYWSKSFRSWLWTTLPEGSGNFMVHVQLKVLEEIEAQKKSIEKQIVLLAKGKYKVIVDLLCSIPGIGILTAMTLATEVVDINRFRSVDQFHSFLGLIPNVYASGETEKVGRITKRHNRFLRFMLIESAWKAAKQDPSLNLAYTRLCKTMRPSKAIVRIAKKLSNRVRYVWKHQVKYEIYL